MYVKHSAMKNMLNKSFILMAVTLFMAACSPISDDVDLFGEKPPQMGFMTTTKTEIVEELGVGVSSGVRLFYERISDYSSGQDESKSHTAEVIRYGGETDYEVCRLYVMFDDLLCATAIVFNTDTQEFNQLLTNYLDRYFGIDFAYLFEMAGMDVEPADLDASHQYLLGMFDSAMYLTAPYTGDAATFDQWLRAMLVGPTMIVHSDFPYREGTGPYTLLTYLDVQSITALTTIYQRLNFVDFVLEQVPVTP